MKTYTNVVFSRWERQVIAKAALSVAIAYPEVHDNKNSRDVRGKKAAQLVALGQDRGIGTHDVVANAVEVLSDLVAVLSQESQHAYWIKSSQQPIEPSEEPTSGWQVYLMLSQIRQRQLEEALAAYKILTAAATLTTQIPNKEDASEDYSDD